MDQSPHPKPMQTQPAQRREYPLSKMIQSQYLQQKSLFQKLHLHHRDEQRGKQLEDTGTSLRSLKLQ